MILGFRCELLFDNRLEVVMANPTDGIKEVKTNYIKFSKKIEAEVPPESIQQTSQDVVLTPVVSVPVQLNDEAGSSSGGTGVMEMASVAIENPMEIEISLEDVDLLTQKLCQQIEGGDFSCILCNFLSNDQNRVVGHIILDHPAWKDSLPNIEKQKKTSKNIFDQQGWKPSLKEDFYNQVIKKCDALTRDSWKNQTKFTEDEADQFVRVRGQIIQKLVDELLGIFGAAPTPTEAELREVIKENLVVGYEFMFGENSATVGRSKGLGSGYGKGGTLGPKTLPKQLKSRILTAQLKMRKKELTKEANNDGDVEIPEGAEKKGKGQGNRSKRYGKCPIISKYFEVL